MGQQSWSLEKSAIQIGRPCGVSVSFRSIGHVVQRRGPGWSSSVSFQVTDSETISCQDLDAGDDVLEALAVKLRRLPHLSVLLNRHLAPAAVVDCRA
eukprot:19370-Chlamydomonas_euryale.AAC.1